MVHQDSQALAKRTQELFNSEQINASITASEVTDQSVENIAAASGELVTDIGSKTPPGPGCS